MFMEIYFQFNCESQPNVKEKVDTSFKKWEGGSITDWVKFFVSSENTLDDKTDYTSRFFRRSDGKKPSVDHLNFLADPIALKVA